MSKKILKSSPYGVAEDPKTLMKHQILLQEYAELEKEANDARDKLEDARKRKMRLLAEVRFLRRRYKYLMEIRSLDKAHQRELGDPTHIDAYRRNGAKNKKSKSTQHRLPPLPDSNQKGKLHIGKETAVRDSSKAVDLNSKVANFKKDSTLRIVSNLSNTRLYGGNEAGFQNSPPLPELNLRGRLFGYNDSTLRIPVPVPDLNESSLLAKEANLRSRAPIFDLNEISTGDEEVQGNCEPVKLEEPKKGLMRVLTNEQHGDIKLTICRNAGEGPPRMGKRKISWQDPVALRV